MSKMSTGQIICKASVPGEYITVGEVYSYTVRQDGSVEYRRADGAGSWMRGFFWQKALEAGQIVFI